MAEEGSRGLTHRSIDRRLDVPLGTVGNYFPTREALIRALTSRMLGMDVAEADGTVGELGDHTAAEAAALLAAAFRAVATGVNEPRFIARLELQLETRRRSVYVDERLAARDLFLDGIASVLGSAGVTDPARHAGAVLALMEGFALDRTFFEGVGFAEEGLEAAVARFISSLPGARV